jgi:hypothetical protein
MAFRPATYAPAVQAATWERIEQAIRNFEGTGRNELTVLVLGKPGNGTSSTANALLAETAFDVRPSLSSRTTPSANAELAVRTWGNFLLRVVHTRSILMQQRPNFAMLQEVVEVLAGRKVDVVLWVDRLDVFRVEELDRQVRCWAPFVRLCFCLLKSLTQVQRRAEEATTEDQCPKSANEEACDLAEIL